MNSDWFGIISGSVVAIGVGIYIGWDYLFPKTVYIENKLKYIDSAVDLHILMKALPRSERVTINNAIVSSIDLHEITFLTSGSFAVFIPMLIIWSYDYFKYRQSILPVKPSSSVNLPEEVEHWYLTHSKSWMYKDSYRYLMDDRDYLLGYTLMLERIDRERRMQPLEPLRELDWPVLNWRDTDLYIPDIIGSKPSSSPSWDKLSHVVECDLKYEAQLDNAILVTDKYVPTFHFKWFTENIDFDLLKSSEIWDYLDILPSHKQQIFMSSLDKFYKIKKIILEHSLVKNVIVDIELPKENLNNLIQ